MTAFSRTLTLVLSLLFVLVGARVMFAGAEAAPEADTPLAGAPMSVDLEGEPESPEESEPSPEETDEEEESGEKLDMVHGALIASDGYGIAHVARDRGAVPNADHGRGIFRPPDAA